MGSLDDEIPFFVSFRVAGGERAARRHLAAGDGAVERGVGGEQRRDGVGRWRRGPRAAAAAPERPGRRRARPPGAAGGSQHPWVGPGCRRPGGSPWVSPPLS